MKCKLARKHRRSDFVQWPTLIHVKRAALLGTPTMEGIMRPTTNRTLLASLGIAALGIVASDPLHADPRQPRDGERERP
jgi:hypothetical protein